MPQSETLDFFLNEFNGRLKDEKWEFHVSSRKVQSEILKTRRFHRIRQTFFRVSLFNLLTYNFLEKSLQFFGVQKGFKMRVP